MGCTPPSRHTEPEEHCCDCSQCWEGYIPKECPYMIPQFCMICNEKSTFAFLLERMRFPGKVSYYSDTVPLWVCDKHQEDSKLIHILKHGVPREKAISKGKLITFLRRELERDLINGK